jgi:hypothetical protein
MKNGTDRIVAEKRAKASQHIADILPLISRIPCEAVEGILKDVDVEIEKAKAGCVHKNGTQVNKKA